MAHIYRIILLCLAVLLCVPAWAGENDQSSGQGDAQNASDEDSTRPRKCGYFECIKLVEPVNDVYYTVQEKHEAWLQASMWGVPSNVLFALNPGITAETKLEPGQKLLIEARLDSAPVPYSQGKTNRGRIYHARPMPEGEGYFLRVQRPNSWGVDTTIQGLMTLFKAYHEKYPNAPDINVGDISRRRGGKLKPHASHQAGRDVDLGFVHKNIEEVRHPDRFISANEDNLDVEKTWFMVETLVRTGQVKVIYVDKRVQRMLYNYAAYKLTPEQRALFFSSPRHSESSSSILQHWPGHRNHFHVRFVCPEGQLGCR